MILKLSEIKPNPNNPRLIKDDKFKKLVQSLKDFPEMAEIREIVINKDHVILGGNMRFKAMKEAGWKEAPVKIVDWPEDKQREFIIKDNVSGGEWDWSSLANEWDIELLDDWGLDLPEQFNSDEDEEDEAPQVSSEPPVSKIGEIYQLGRHSVMCGDSTDFGSVSDLMDGKQADMVFTDPPYGINLNTDYSGISGNWSGKVPFAKSKKYDRVINDNVDYDPSHLFEQFSDVKEVFLWGANYYASLLPELTKSAWYVWDKTGSGEQETVGSEFELCWSRQKHKQQIIKLKWAGVIGLSNQDTKSRVHPTQKPVELCSWFIEKYSKADDIIIDSFLGSGSTLIACEKTNRICYGMEIDPKYCDVIRKRYWKFVNNNDETGWEENTPVISERATTNG